MASIIKKLINGILSDVIQLEHSAQDIDDSITKTSQLTGRNLLDNWYFGNPVNQRGQTEYTKAGYTIDRWEMLIDIGTITLTPEDGGVVLDGTTNAITLIQLQEDELLKSLEGRTVTASILYTVLSDGTGNSTLSHNENDSIKDIVVLTHEIGKADIKSTTFTVVPKTTTTVLFWLYVALGCKIKVHAVKLELGDHQTLARKAVDGTWVLIDPPPNKAEELAKCQRYFYRKKGTGSYSNYGNGYINSANGAFIFVNVPEMRVAPTVAASGNFRLSTPGTAISVTSISSGGASTNGFNRISASATNSLTSNTPVMLQANNDASTYIDFSADL